MEGVTPLIETAWLEVAAVAGLNIMVTAVAVLEGTREEMEVNLIIQQAAAVVRWRRASQLERMVETEVKVRVIPYLELHKSILVEAAAGSGLLTQVARLVLEVLEQETVRQHHLQTDLTPRIMVAAGEVLEFQDIQEALQRAEEDMAFKELL